MDLHKWNKAFLNGAVLPSESLEKGSNRLELNEGRLTNLSLLNWYRSEDGSSYHFTGDWRGFYTMAYRDLEKKRSIVFITNGSMPSWLRAQLVCDVNQILEGGSVKFPKAPMVEPIQNMEQTLGSYKFSDTTTGKITQTLNKVYFQWDDGPKYPIYLTKSNIIYIPGLDYWLWFAQQNNMKSSELILSHVNGQKNGSVQKSGH